MGVQVRFDCPDWWDRLQRGLTPISEQRLDPNLAEVAVKLFDKLRVPDVPGQPTMGEAAGEWIRDVVRAAFGSVDLERRARLVGELLLLVPKKNAKTTSAAALGLVALQMNTTPNISGVIIGPTQEVADLCFAQAAAMIEADPWLAKRFRVIEHRKTIVDLYPDPETGRPLNAKLKVKSFDPAVVTGGIPAFAILDELHVMAAKSYAARVIGQIRGGMITNPLSLLVIITTQSEEVPVGVFRDELEYARRVRDGLIQGHVRMLPVLYELPESVQAAEGKPWTDPRTWPAVLPNLGRSITIERLVPDFEKARATSAAELARWASQHLNIQVGTGTHLSQWAGGLYWPGVAGKVTLDRILAECEVAVVGIDGGGMDDLLGLAVVGRLRGGGGWIAWGRAWVHEAALRLRPGIAARLRGFEADGDLVVCEERAQDVAEVAAICGRLDAAGLLPAKAAIGLDPEGVAAIVDALEAEDLEPAQLVPVSQGYKLNGAIKGTERKLFDGSLVHGGQPLMDWCVGNAKTEPRGNAVIVTKAVSGAGKIDPLMALFNAVHLMSLNPEGAPGIDGFLGAPVMVMG